MVQIEKQKQLDEKLLKHDFSCKERYTQAYASAKRMAENYASVENALVVLSNMMLDVCYICYGRLGRAMGLGEINDFPHYGYHGYYPLDYTQMDKNYGTIEEMRELVNTLHAQGIF